MASSRSIPGPGDCLKTINSSIHNYSSDDSVAALDVQFYDVHLLLRYGGRTFRVSSRPMAARRPAAVHVLVAGMVGVSALLCFLDSSGGMVQNLGRNPTLTGRTEIWDAVLPLAGNPLIGTGYESFGSGSGARSFGSSMEELFYGINEAHNGYLELFLNLGWIGIALLAVLIATGYRKVMATFRCDPPAGSLGLAFFASELVYNFTEAGFKMMFPLWIFFF